MICGKSCDSRGLKKCHRRERIWLCDICRRPDRVQPLRRHRRLTTVISSLSNHCSLSSARGHMSGLRAVFIRLTQRRDSSSPGEPATLVLSFTWNRRKGERLVRSFSSAAIRLLSPISQWCSDKVTNHIRREEMKPFAVYCNLIGAATLQQCQSLEGGPPSIRKATIEPT